MDNIILQIVFLVAGLGLIVFFGVRAVKDRKAKAKASKKKGTTRGTNTRR